MGAQGSKGAGAEDTSDGEQPVDYYTLLEVEEDASQDEIRKSFRKLALIHHPDKNPNNIDEATKKFAQLQQAYEVLSDEQERAWYDSHHASLAPEPDAEAVFEDIRNGAPPPRKRMNDPGLQAKHIIRFMDASIWQSMDDSDTSFFTIYRNLFVRLAAEENNFTAGDVEYPSFGYSTWSWSGNANNKTEPRQASRDFYNAWLAFSTAKDFTWQERWNSADAPDRRVRRMMEQENKKAREDARRDYNETVMALVQFIRKRDPRYKEHLTKQAATTAQKKAESRNTKSTKPVAPKASRQEELVNEFVEQAWQQIQTPLITDEIGEGEWADHDGEEIECVVCQKTFKSEKAWANHERSKKHITEVELLKWRLRQENKELGLSEEGIVEPTNQDGAQEERDEGDLKDHDQEAMTGSALAAEDGDEFDNSRSGTPRRKKGKKKNTTPSDDNLTSAAASSPPEVAESISALSLTAENGVPGTSEDPEETSSAAVGAAATKREKRRAREAAKKAQEAENTVKADPETCNVCGEVFPSRTKLFAHIKDSGHALAEPNGNKGGRKVGPNATSKMRR